MLSDSAYHNNSITSMVMDGTRLFTGSLDASINMYTINPTTNEIQPAGKLELGDPVYHVAIFGAAVMWSTESIPIEEDGIAASASVGVVTLLADPADQSSCIICKRPEVPYTHPMPVKTFVCGIVGGHFTVLTAGAEGLIREWKLDEAQRTFVHFAILEGHTREVTCLLLQGSFILIHYFALFRHLIIILRPHRHWILSL